MFYVYDPNEEDKDISKYSANIIVPEEVLDLLPIAVVYPLVYASIFPPLIIILSTLLSDPIAGQ